MRPDLIGRRGICCYAGRRGLLAGSSTLLRDGESTVDAAKRIACLLNDSVLAIQGPPGAGKTFAGARMMCELIRQGKKVGITAVSHKVIRNLLDEVALGRPGKRYCGPECVQKVSEKTKENRTASRSQPTTRSRLRHCGPELRWLRVQLGCGRARTISRRWTCSLSMKPGQMSLANVLAVAQAAKSLVLLGDPQQLDQPQKGSHPEGAEVSALEHLLAGARTIPSDKGLFLERTWRLHPAICEFTSEVFYEGRLNSRDGLERQSVAGTRGLAVPTSGSSQSNMKVTRIPHPRRWSALQPSSNRFSSPVSTGSMTKDRSYVAAG